VPNKVKTAKNKNNNDENKSNIIEGWGRGRRDNCIYASMTATIITIFSFR